MNFPYEEDDKKLKALKAPFDDAQLQWRVMRTFDKGGKHMAWMLAYMTARMVADRLDDTFGAHHWQFQLVPVQHGTDTAWIGRLGVFVYGEWVWKDDASDESDIEGVKGGASGALKRAAVQWGIGRYLYGMEDVCVELTGDQKWAKPKDSERWKLDKAHQAAIAAAFSWAPESPSKGPATPQAPEPAPEAPQRQPRDISSQPPPPPTPEPGPEPLPVGEGSGSPVLTSEKGQKAAQMIEEAESYQRLKEVGALLKQTKEDFSEAEQKELNRLYTKTAEEWKVAP